MAAPTVTFAAAAAFGIVVTGEEFVVAAAAEEEEEDVAAKTLGAKAEVVLNLLSFLSLAAVFQLGFGLLVFFSSERL